MELENLENAEVWLTHNGAIVQQRAWTERDQTAQRIVDIHGAMLDADDGSGRLRELIEAVMAYRRLHGDLAKVES